MGETLKETRVPFDTVMVIFAFIGARKRFPYDIAKINTAFYKLSQEKEFKGLFNDFNFVEQSYMWSFPYCKEVGCALDTLFFSRLLECIGPDMSDCEVTENLAQGDFSVIFTREERDLLRKASEKFQEYVKEV